MAHDIGGRLVQGFCNCGRPAVKKGTDNHGRSRYRNRCSHCIRMGRKHKKNKCNWCAKVFEDKTMLQIDHIDNDPSNNDESNLQTLCMPCHINKTIIYKDWKNNGRNKGKSNE